MHRSSPRGLTPPSPFLAEDPDDEDELSGVANTLPKSSLVPIAPTKIQTQLLRNPNALYVGIPCIYQPLY